MEMHYDTLLEVNHHRYFYEKIPLTKDPQERWKLLNQWCKEEVFSDKHSELYKLFQVGDVWGYSAADLLTLCECYHPVDINYYGGLMGSLDIQLDKYKFTKLGRAIRSLVVTCYHKEDDKDLTESQRKFIRLLDYQVKKVYEKYRQSDDYKSQLKNFKKEFKQKKASSFLLSRF